MATFDETTARANLISWVANNYGSGLSSVPAVWADTNDKSVFRERGPVAGIIKVNLVNPAILGFDEILYSSAQNPNPGEELLVNVKVSGTITLDIRIEVQDHRPEYNAHAFARNLRNSLRFPSTTLLFGAAGLGYQRVLSQTPLDSIYQGRVKSACQLDIALNVAWESQDSATTYIETVEYETAFRDTTGTLLPTQQTGTITLP